MSKLDELGKVEPCEYHYDCWYCSKFNDYVVSKARLEEREAVARTIGLSASTAGLSPKDLAKDDDWKEAVEKIKRSERQALKKMVEGINFFKGTDLESHEAARNIQKVFKNILLNELNKN